MLRSRRIGNRRAINELADRLSQLGSRVRAGAALIWLFTATQSQHVWQWLRLRARVFLWAAGITVAVLLLTGLSTHWTKYREQHEAFAPLFTLSAGLAVAWVTLIRHFAQTNADRQRRITESYSKAVEQLASDRIELRLGGIYTLEKISQESPDRYWTIMETLTAFVREHASWTEIVRRTSERAYFLWLEAGRPEGRAEEFWLEAEPEKCPTDIAAVLTVIKRRRPEDCERGRKNRWELDLQSTDLRGADLAGAHLEWASLNLAHLEGADLSEAHLEGAWLVLAHLEGASLFGTQLHAHLPGAHLEGADLGLAGLEGARLVEAHFEGAFLGGAHLERANLRDTHLEGAYLRGATGLTTEQLAEAYGDAQTRLPADVERPAHWPPESPEEDPDKC